MFSPFAFPLQVTMSRRHCQARGLLLLMVLCGLAADLGHVYHMQADAKTVERLTLLDYIMLPREGISYYYIVEF